MFLYDVHVTEAAKRKGLAKHLMTMLELIARRANMSEIVAPVPNSPVLAAAVTAFFESGMKGYAQVRWAREKKYKITRKALCGREKNAQP